MFGLPKHISSCFFHFWKVCFKKTLNDLVKLTFLQIVHYPCFLPDSSSEWSCREVLFRLRSQHPHVRIAKRDTRLSTSTIFRCVEGGGWSHFMLFGEATTWFYRKTIIFQSVFTSPKTGSWFLSLFIFFWGGGGGFQNTHIPMKNKIDRKKSQPNLKGQDSPKMPSEKRKKNHSRRCFFVLGFRGSKPFYFFLGGGGKTLGGSSQDGWTSVVHAFQNGLRGWPFFWRKNQPLNLTGMILQVKKTLSS